MSLRQIRRIAALGLVTGGAVMLRAVDTGPVFPDFEPVSWLAAAGPVLAKAGVAVDRITMAPVGTDVRKGDTLTVLVQAADRKGLRQWAVVLSVNDIKPEEQALRSPAMTWHLSTGRKVDFGPSPFEGILIHVIGPFSAARGATASKDVWSGSLVNPQYLALGLDGCAALLVRVSQLVGADPVLKGRPISLDVNNRPFPAGVIAETNAWSGRLAMTEAEDRAFAGLFPALVNFFQIASQTPGVREIVLETLDIPWWSVVAHGGRITNVEFELFGPFVELAAADWGLPPDARVYALGLRLKLQGKPALQCRLAVTAPRVPLFNSAGIVGLAAMRPNGRGPHLMVRVMAARAAADPAGR